MEGRSQRVEGSLGRRGSLGEERLPLCVQPPWGRGGWKRAAPSIFVPREPSWLEGLEVAASSGDLRSEVWLSKLPTPTNASPHPPMVQVIASSLGH